MGYGGNFLEDAKEVEIVPFSQKQTQDYIKTWFANDSVSAKMLIAELQDKPQISGLAQNPLLLLLLCRLYQEKDITLPTRRVQVYEETVNYMLGKWSQNRKSLSVGEITAKRQLLENIAYFFSNSNQEIFSDSELYDEIKKYYQDNKEISVEEISVKAMKELTEEYGILQKLDREGNNYLFLHRTFHEYLTACYLNRVIKNDIVLVKNLFWRYESHETLTLLAGLMKKPVTLIASLYEENDDIFQTLLLLAGRCIGEIQDNQDSLITKIVNEIYNFWQRYPSAGFIKSNVVALGKSNSQICRKLQETLKDSNSDVTVREQAAEILGDTGNPIAVDVLISVLLDSKTNKHIRGNAAEALGKIGNPQAIDALITALGDSYWMVKRNAAKALGEIGNPQAVDTLISAINDLDHGVRWQAAKALGKIGNSQGVDTLISALNHSDSDDVILIHSC